MHLFVGLADKIAHLTASNLVSLNNMGTYYSVAILSKHKEA